MLAENKITLASLYKILFEEEPLTLSDQCMQKLEESFHFLKTFSNDKIIYGINTGFGPMAQYRIEYTISFLRGDKFEFEVELEDN